MLVVIMKLKALVVAVFVILTTLCVAKTERTEAMLDCLDFEIRGIYLGASNEIMQKLKKAKNLNVNAVVIDIRNDYGEVTCNLNTPKIRYVPYIRNIKQLLIDLKKMGIYTIARIVTFRTKTPNSDTLAIKNMDGSVYTDEEKMNWLNPYNNKTWEYLAQIVEAAAMIGFDEIQFDYIRLPQYKSLETTDIKHDMQRKTKEDIVNDFLDFIIPKLRSLNVKVSVDVFGCTIPESLNEKSCWSSRNIGQNYVAISKKVDYICPMIYPSHWPPRSMGVRFPDLDPGKIVKQAMSYSNKALSSDTTKARPWLQAFTATWLKKGYWREYKLKQMQEQVNALRELGLKQFCFWNPAARYKF